MSSLDSPKVSWVGRCDGLREQDLHDYDDTEEEINYQRFKHYVGEDVIRALEDDYGYTGSGLTLEDDFAVSFGKGKWRGEWAVCMHWSAYHHIWTINE